MSTEEVDLYGDLYADVEATAEDDDKPLIDSGSVSAPIEEKPFTNAPAFNNYAGNNDNYGASSSNDNNYGNSSGGGQSFGNSQSNAPAQFDGGYNANAGQPGMSNNTRPNDMPEEGKMFVGGLNWDTTDEGLKTYFEQFGTVTHCTIMRDGETQRSRGFAFLTFAQASSVNAVMTREHYLDGKTIDPKRAIPRENAQKTDKLFVRSIPNSCTQESFRTFWRAFGNITDATLMMDKESGRHRGFGFVNYEHVESVEKVLSTGPHQMEGQTLEVKRAQLKGEARQPGYGQPMNQQNQNQNYNHNNGGYNNNNNQQSSNSYNQSGQSQGGNGGGGAFDPQAMAKFFQSMNWGGWNPMMMGGNGMPGGGGGMPGMGMPGMPMGMTGMGMPGMPMMGMPGMGMPMGMPGMDMGMYGGQGGFGQQGSMRGGMASRGGRGGAQMGRGGHAPSGPALMRSGDESPESASTTSGADAGGPGPTRSRGGGAGFHPYARN